MNYQYNFQAQISYALTVIILTGINILIVSEFTNIF